MRLLLLRADIARPALPDRLREAGGEVTEVAAYQTRVADYLPSHVLDSLRSGSLDYVTFTSSSTARNLVQLLSEESDLLRHARLASIGPITSRTMNSLGLKPNVEALEANVSSLADAVVRDVVGDVVGN